MVGVKIEVGLKEICSTIQYITMRRDTLPVHNNLNRIGRH